MLFSPVQEIHTVIVRQIRGSFHWISFGHILTFIQPHANFPQDLNRCKWVCSYSRPFYLHFEKPAQIIWPYVPKMFPFYFLWKKEDITNSFSAML